MIEHKKDNESSIGSSEEQKSFFFCLPFIHRYSTYTTMSMTCHVEFQLTTIIRQQTNTPGQPHKKHTSQQKHNTTTSSKGIVSTMARTPAKGSTPPSSTPPKRNKQKSNDNVSNKRKCKETNDNAKSNEALIDTSSKTGAVTVNLTVHNVDNNVATHTADPDSLDNACHDKQQQTGQSMETTEGDESNAEDSKTTQENNNDTPVLGSTVSKKNNIFHFGKYCLYYLSHIITFFCLP
jgi:hypothetical protein